MVVAGPPASGKGDVCKQLVAKMGFVQLSTVSTYRFCLNKGVPEADEAKKAIDDKKSIPDEVMAKLLAQRIKEEDCTSKGWFIDGYPRTKGQAELLAEAGVKPQILVSLEVSDERLVEKQTLRRVDPETQLMYHLKDNPPPKDEAIEARLVQRPDDNEDKVKEQIAKYHGETDGLLEAWADVLVKVDCDCDVGAVVANIEAAIKEKSA